MIRVVTLEPYEDKDIAKLCKTLYAAFGVGTEASPQAEVPAGITEPYPADALLDRLSVYAFADDRVLFVTPRRLQDRALISGVAPTFGFAQYGKRRAIISTQGFKNFEASIKAIGRHAMHQLGHLWELHHCLDPRCAMYPPWTPSFPLGETSFCVYCREKSEQKLRLEKS